MQTVGFLLAEDMDQANESVYTRIRGVNLLAAADDFNFLFFMFNLQNEK